jgi:hypothetical protein
MAATHHAYTFDPPGFHTTLLGKVVIDSRLSLEALQNTAVAGVVAATEDTRQVLQVLRYNEEWLDASPSEANYGSEWYMVALSQYLTLAPSLSHRSHFSWSVLEHILPSFDWDQRQIRSLIYGRPLSELVESSGSRPLLDKIRGVDQYGGWLDLKTAKGLLSRLSRVDTAVHKLANGAHQSVSAYAQLAGQQAEKLMDDAYADAIDMLSAAVNGNQALLLVLDY